MLWGDDSVDARAVKVGRANANANQMTRLENVEQMRFLLLDKGYCGFAVRQGSAIGHRRKTLDNGACALDKFGGVKRHKESFWLEDGFKESPCTVCAMVDGRRLFLCLWSLFLCIAVFITVVLEFAGRADTKDAKDGVGRRIGFT